MEEDYVKMLFVDNLIITILAIFVLVYIYYNWGTITWDKFYLNGNFSNPVLVTAVIILLSLLIIGDKYDKPNVIGGINEITKPTVVNAPVIQPAPVVQTPIVSAPAPAPIPATSVPIKGGISNFKIKTNEIFVPYNQKSMYMDVNV